MSMRARAQVGQAHICRRDRHNPSRFRYPEGFVPVNRAILDETSSVYCNCVFRTILTFTMSGTLPIEDARVSMYTLAKRQTYT